MKAGRAKRAVISVLAALSLAGAFGAVAGDANARPSDDGNGCYFLGSATPPGWYCNG